MYPKNGYFQDPQKSAQQATQYRTRCRKKHWPMRGSKNEPPEWVIPGIILQPNTTKKAHTKTLQT